MTRFIARPLGVIAAGLLAVGFSPAGAAFATGDTDDAQTPGTSTIVTTSTAANRAAQPAPTPVVEGRGAERAPAAAPLAVNSVPPAAGCHVVWANIFGPVCMPGK